MLYAGYGNFSILFHHFNFLYFAYVVLLLPSVFLFFYLYRFILFLRDLKPLSTSKLSEKKIEIFSC
jgi:hypothetical protein